MPLKPSRKLGGFFVPIFFAFYVISTEEKSPQETPLTILNLYRFTNGDFSSVEMTN